MPPPMPRVSACSAASSAVSTSWASPRATPAADSSATRMTARPLADSQPKKAAPHLMPPKRARWTATASRAAPRVARAPLAPVVGAHRRVVVVLGVVAGHGWAPPCGDPAVVRGDRVDAPRRPGQTEREDGRPFGRPGGGLDDRAAGRRGQRRRLPAGRLVARPGRRDDPAAGPAGRARRAGADRSGRRPGCTEVVAVVEGQGRRRVRAGRRDGRAGRGQRGRRAGRPRRDPLGRRTLLVVTADRGLRARLPAGTAVTGPGWLLALLDDVDRACRAIRPGRWGTTQSEETRPSACPRTAPAAARGRPDHRRLERHRPRDRRRARRPRRPPGAGRPRARRRSRRPPTRSAPPAPARCWCTRPTSSTRTRSATAVDATVAAVRPARRRRPRRPGDGLRHDRGGAAARSSRPSSRPPCTAPPSSPASSCRCSGSRATGISSSSTRCSARSRRRCMGSYIAAKWGQLGLVRVLQQETRDVPGIDVSIVQPGGVDTPIYFQAASWAGSTGRPPPPVYSPQRLGRRIVSLLDRPRRQVQAGIFNPLITAGLPAGAGRLRRPGRPAAAAAGDRERRRAADDGQRLRVQAGGQRHRGALAQHLTSTRRATSRGRGDSHARSVRVGSAAGRFG